ncbi:sorting nexin-like protein [Pseudozyma hubeiensis SY62]|uniref:Sorting nexin-like protein n=1 Tax=Pseudozyma hubeiensis (strain SY62) TaxID=1305764 RepID=R9PA75_PSEHS|nr:sorting nexin-like protein [Pseudozyma hubeiensis SY62]GAC98157.1 sorting nexin-like protein [Pseudozyma hubeiensis SY62]
MEAELAKELREATDQLLDIAPARPSAFAASPHLQQTRRDVSPSKIEPASTRSTATFSASSKLEVLHSPTDVRPFQWPVPPTSTVNSGVDNTGSPSNTVASRSHDPIKIELGTSLLDDADDNLPARGLSSRTRSVKAGTAQEHDDTQILASSHLSDGFDQELRVPSPSKLRVRTPVNDIYINQYGERVVQGKVVGRTLGGRPRPQSRERDPSTAADECGPDPSSILPSTSAKTTSESTTTSTSTPPAFFLESFPDAFQSAAGTSPTKPPPPVKKKARRPSRGGPPSIIRAPRAVAGALTLAHWDNNDDVSIVLDTSSDIASDFGSPSSASSKQLSMSPRPRKARLSSSASSRPVDKSLTEGLLGLRLQSEDRSKSQSTGKDTALLSPAEGVATVDSTRSQLELPSIRRPTPTIELSQAKADPVVLHGNRRQARASGMIQPQDEARSGSSSKLNSPAVSPPTNTSALPATSSDQSAQNHDQNGARTRLESASEPSSPLISPRRERAAYWQSSEHHERAEIVGDKDDVDNASLESAPSSLISLPVSTLTSSSRSPSHHSLERRRSGGSSFSHRRRQSSASIRNGSSDVFAREVRIRGWSEVGSQARGWVVFELRIITKQGTPIVAHKRFSSFVKLRSTLLNECKDQAKWLPQLPTRRTGLLSKYDASDLKRSVPVSSACSKGESDTA